MAMEGLIKTLPAVVRASGNAPEVIEAAAIAAWKHAAGEHLKEHTVPICLQDRILKIAVADAIWQKQLHSMRGQLLFRVNSILGKPLVGALDFVVDPKLAKPPVEQPAQRDELLDNEVPLELWSAASAIQDKDLRKKFLQTALLSLRHKD